MNNGQAEMMELFSSIQGEGLLVGLRQVFIRFCGCNFTCNYCDTESNQSAEFCLVEGTPGRRDFIQVKNPVPLERVTCLIRGWQSGWPGIHHSISITGGEPLLHTGQLQEWLPVLRDFLPIYLETNGVLHAELAQVISHVDHIGMDIKLPSTSGCADLWQAHLDFLRIAAVKNVFVKTVIDNSTEDWEIIRASEIIASIDKSIPLILQPLTSSDGKIDIAPLKMLELQETACNFLDEVRIIPQTHRFIGQL
jgi:7-carboxy-7-deazaguanine synthase